jgi:hypothetical protein
LCLAAVACEAARPCVEIVQPAEGDSVTGAVRVVLAASGIEIVPATEERAGTGHHHLFLGRDATPPGDTIPQGVTGVIHLGRGQTEFTFDSLAPGTYRLIAVLANLAHVALDPPAVDTVRFTVR